MKVRSLLTQARTGGCFSFRMAFEDNWLAETVVMRLLTDHQVLLKQLPEYLTDAEQGSCSPEVMSRSWSKPQSHAFAVRIGCASSMQLSV